MRGSTAATVVLDHDEDLVVGVRRHGGGAAAR
jgi:hypothetical protein